MDLLGLINQMRGMGFFSGFEGTPSASDIANLSSTDIMNQIRQTYSIPGGDGSGVDLDPGMFSSFDMNQLLGGMQKTYSPQLESAGGSLSDSLAMAIGGKEGKQAYGGFAGSGAGQSFTQGARDVYGRKMGEELSNIEQQKAMWAESTDPTIQQWMDVGQTYSAPA